MSKKKLGYIHVKKFYSNCYEEGKEDFIDKLADEIKENALKQINIDNQKIKDEIIKEDTTYCLVDGTNKKSIVNKNTFKDSEVK